jgi:hypothetical protein
LRICRLSPLVSPAVHDGTWETCTCLIFLASPLKKLSPLPTIAEIGAYYSRQ